MCATPGLYPVYFCFYSNTHISPPQLSRQCPCLLKFCSSFGTTLMSFQKPSSSFGPFSIIYLVNVCYRVSQLPSHITISGKARTKTRLFLQFLRKVLHRKTFNKDSLKWNNKCSDSESHLFSPGNMDMKFIWVWQKQMAGKCQYLF